MAKDHTVLLLDDDAGIRKQLESLLAAKGYTVRAHSSTDEVLKDACPSGPCCLLLDQRLSKGMSGIHLRSELRNRGWDIPTILLAADWDVRDVVASMRAGADGVLTKPVNPDELWDSVSHAFSMAIAIHHRKSMAAEESSRIESLTPREREIVTLVTSGLLNKEIAGELGLALVTVKVHRARIMRKLKAGNPAELARIASRAGLGPAMYPGFGSVSVSDQASRRAG